VAVNLVIPTGTDPESSHLKKTGNGLRVGVARSEMVHTSGPPASVTGCLPRDPPLDHFETRGSQYFYISQSATFLREIWT
jgi:hypothetical protein